MKNLRSSVHLDMLRGLAALAVLVYHSWGVLMDRPATGGDLPPAVGRLIRELVSHGHHAVIVFFVLSGFLISGSVIQDGRSNRWSWGRYAVGRSTRMYVVLIPALAITAALDQLGLALFADRIDPQDPGNAWVDPDAIRSRSTLPTLLGNVGFVQTILVPVFGSNVPLWSLANEVWYYAVFPCLWFGIRPGAGWLGRVLLLAAAGGMLAFTGPDIALYFLIWLLGTGLYLVRTGRGPASPPYLLWGGVGAFLAGLVAVPRVAARLPGAEVVTDFALGVLTAALVYILLGDRRPEQPTRYARVAKLVAGCSFTLYAVHIPVLVFVRCALSPPRRWPVDPPHVGYWAAISAGVFLAAYLVARGTEAHTDRVRRRVSRWIWKPSERPAAGR